MRNYPEWMLIYWACVSMGVAVVGMNAWWVAEEMEYAIKDSTPKVIFCDAERLARIRERPGHGRGHHPGRDARRPTPTTASSPGAMSSPTAGALPDVAVDPDADACIFYTSGTTGFPKGAQLTHRGCISNLFSMMFAGQVQALATQRGDRRRHRPGRAGPPIPVGLAHHAPVPRHRQQLRRLRGHRGGRQAGPDVPLGRRARP